MKKKVQKSKIKKNRVSPLTKRRYPPTFFRSRFRPLPVTGSLKDVSFENFKIFKAKNKFNFSDFNIILGNNGVGKSTIAELFKLLKQSRNSNLVNTLITYKGDYKSWPSPYNLFFNRDNSSEIMFEFETSISKPFFLMGTKTKSSVKKRMLRHAGIDPLLFLFKCLQLSTLEKWNIEDYLIKNNNLDIDKLIYDVSHKIDKTERIIGMDFKIQLYFDVFKDSNDSDHLGISCLKIIDEKTNNILFEFMTRRRIENKKIFNKKHYIKSDAKSHTDYLKNLKSLTKKYIQDQDTGDTKFDDDSLILVSLCTSTGSRKFWKITRALLAASFHDYSKEPLSYEMTPFRDMSEMLVLFLSGNEKKLMELCHSSNHLTGVSLLNTEEDFINRPLSGKRRIFGYDEYFLRRDHPEYFSRYDTNPINGVLSFVNNYLNERDGPGIQRNIKKPFFTGLFQPINFFLHSSIFIKSANYIDQINYEPNISPPEPLSIAFEEQWSPEMIVTYLFHNKDKIDIINKWLPKLGLDFTIQMVRITNKSELPMVRINAFDSKTKTNQIDLQDLGLGAATALRIVLIILCTEQKNIFLTEPEQNLHPKVHINFVNLIEHSIRKNKNTFFVETHSENLTLKLFQLIRNKKFKNNQVSINVVTKSNRGGKIKKIEVDENGDQISAWPGGFFAEKYDLV